MALSQPSVEPTRRPQRPSRRAWRLALYASVLLALACVVLTHLVVRELPRPRLDGSSDQLFGLHPSTRALLARLEDVLTVEQYFTGEVRHGSVQIAKGRLLDQLRDVADAAGARIERASFDPTASSEARLAAEKEGLAAVPLRGQQGTAQVVQNVWLGLVLRYRGRTRAIPFVLPQSFEFAFAEAVADLLRDERPRIGFLVESAGDATGASGGDGFRGARELLARRAQISEVSGLASGRAVPAELDLLVVAAPERLAPRAVFALDQYAQGGGRLLLLLERQRIDPSTASVRSYETGLEDLLRAWHVPLSRLLVWDSACNEISTRDGGAQLKLEYPLWVRVGEAGMDPTVPATGRLNGCDLFWAHAFGPEPDANAPRAPPGVERVDLVASSARSWLVEPLERLAIDPQALNDQNAELLAAGTARARPLAVALRGKLPSPFAASGAPRPLLPGGAADPNTGPTGEPVRSAERAAQIVALGDADFARTPFLTERNQILLANLVDWLVLEGELVALRARMPRERRIADFLDEERRARGLTTLAGETEFQQDESRTSAEEAAADAAAARRWMTMAAAALGTLLSCAVAVLARRATRRRVEAAA
ncbi:MAG: hypothetical protein EPO68_03960 [Planctomycetota bacterium]|nr:MAG: hypothetical protein EPO68_03960 [Planctomycetota bacterium]